MIAHRQPVSACHYPSARCTPLLRPVSPDPDVPRRLSTEGMTPPLRAARRPPRAARARCAGCCSTSGARRPSRTSSTCRPGRAQRSTGRSGQRRSWSLGCRRQVSSGRGSTRLDAADRRVPGRHVVIATGTASGKSLAYLLPVRHPAAGGLPRRAALYLAPTKALARDQLRSLRALASMSGCARRRTTATPRRPSATGCARTRTYVLTNPDMLTTRCCPDTRGGRRSCAVCSSSSSTSATATAASSARTSRRCCGGCGGSARAYGAAPTFVLASATVAEPASTARRLTGLRRRVVTEDASPRGRSTFALWEPPLPHLRGRARRAGTALGDRRDRRPAGRPGRDGVRTLAFVRSRRGAEASPLGARRPLAEVGAASSPDRVAAYRGGYLPEDRRELEPALRSGELLGLAATNALELGVDVSGLDAVLLAGFPGHPGVAVAAGRAGRRARRRRAGRARRPRRPAGHLPRAPSRGAVRPAGRGQRARPGQPLRAGAAPVRAPPPSCRSPRRTSTLFGPAARPRCSTTWSAAGCCGAGRRAGSGPGATGHDLADLRGTGGAPVPRGRGR